MAVVAALIVLVGDSQALALIPLLGVMSEEFHLTASQATVVLAILGIVGAGALPVLTRLAERVSLRRFLLLGVAMTTLGNVLCALAPGFTLLLIGRIVLGLSAAIPISLALVREKSTDAHGTNRGLGLVTAAVGVGVAFSFLLGGTVLQLQGSVHTVFWVMAVLAALTFVVGWILVPDYRVQSRTRIDYLGAALLIVGLTLIAVAISYASEWGSGAVLALVIGFVAMGGWVWWELSVSSPMIDLRRTFRRSAVPAYFAAGLFAAVAIISNLAVTSYAEFTPVPGVPELDYGYGYIVLMASLFLMPTAFFILFGGFFVGRVITRIGIKTSFFIAGALTVVGFTFMALGHSEIWQNAVGMGIWGIAYALGSTTANAAFLHAAKDSEASLFSAAATTVTGTIGSLAAPVFTAVLYATAVVVPVNGAKVSVPTAQSYTNLWWVLAAAGVVMLLMAVLHKTVQYQGGTEPQTVIAPDATTGAPTAEVLPEER
ncbi:MFS transporter [Humibacter sp. RRB41]|uniref:MFS transporter n=1 Tax=Humibacter sp. RRB41 TaxID=2919946 RepID=UPI001FA9C1A5|nr:MFS transporter [Humibacter sp. RRB41]